MLASITPLGERGRRANWTVTATIFILGSIAGGAVLGAAFGLVGSLALTGVGIGVRLGLLAAALVVGLAWELTQDAVPGPRRQVDERWLDGYRSWVYGLGFGAQLGAGVATVVVTSAVYAVLVAAFVSADPAVGAAIGAAAGALRGATLLASYRIVTPARLIAFHERMHRLRRPVRSVALVAQLGASTLAIAAAVALG
jgi:hypothetical protein